MQSLLARGNKEGPLFSNGDGKPIPISKLVVYFHTLLKEVQRHYPKVIEIEESNDVEREYSTYCSLCRGSTSEAQNAVIATNVIESHNH